MASQLARDRFADIGAFLFAAGFSVLTYEDVLAGEEIPSARLFYEQLGGLLACVLLFLRRRWPVPLAVVLPIAGTWSHFVTGPIMVALFTVACLRPLRVSRWAGALAFAPLPWFLLSRPDPAQPGTASAIVYFALAAASFGWGLYVRSRRQLVAELRLRAEQAEAAARRQAREDVAREMHDVLAHRLSLLSVHAGALEYNPGASPEDVRRASAVIRDSAHQALEDLREVIGVLRSPVGPDDAERPQPTAGDLGRLVAESRRAGLPVELEVTADDLAGVPAGVGRTAYRVVQEGLTNALKHAPGASARVVVAGRQGRGLELELRNAVPSRGGASGAGIPGAGQGLNGLAERVELAGGRLEHGRTGGDFRLYAWLPWSA
ncbi:histidine kinase [Streptomyces bambusae]|uniref:sensor histidine kinase n=1 Tax=Streptomyces bambusae TaxID=1550616 RepID=UPI001CFE34E6|nr:histidine kinase [Streptomyces bambusae]MCB5163299.1 histidine kinase [Streptomyces bambusae]